MVSLLCSCRFKASAGRSRPKVSTNGTETRPGSPSPSPQHGDGGSGPHVPRRHAAAAPPVIDPEIRSSFNSVDSDRSGYITAKELQSALIKGGWPSFEIDTVKLLMSIFDANRNGTIDITEFDGLWKYIKKWEGEFRRFDKNHNNAIDGDELQQALKQLGYNLSPRLQDLLKRKYDVNWVPGQAATEGGQAAAPPAATENGTAAVPPAATGGGPATAPPVAAGGGPAAAPPAATGGGQAAAPPAAMGGGQAAAPPGATEGGQAAALPAGHSTWSGITFDRFVRACAVVKQLKESFEVLHKDPYGNARIDYDAFVEMAFKLP